MSTDELFNYLFSPIGLTALVMGIAELAKKIGCPNKYIPLVDLLFGIIGGIAVFGFELDYGIFKGIIIGVAIGLSACGLFSGIKNIAKEQDDYEN